MEPVLQLIRLTAYNLTDPAFLVFGRRAVPAVQDVTLSVDAGQTVALLGESGSGRSTLLRVAALQQPRAGGRIVLAGRNITRRRQEPGIQGVPQDPRRALALDRPFGTAVAAELQKAGRGGGEAARARLAELLGQLGLAPGYLDRAPGTCSGGELQRMALARALAFDPAVLLLDEPVSGVDPHTAERVVRALRTYQARHRTAVLLATHDLRLARRLAHRAVVLLSGRVVESGPIGDILADPIHPHSRQLLGLEDEWPSPDPDLAAPHSGCPFFGRCPLEEPRCDKQVPELHPTGSGRLVACHAQTEASPGRSRG